MFTRRTHPLTPWTLCVPLCLLALSSLASPAQAADLFPDKNLEAAVRKYVFEKRDNNKPLTEGDVKTLSTIVAVDKKITNLAGLEKCTALMELNIENNQVADLKPIAELKNLQTLTLRQNKITDLAPVSKLVNLQYLNFEENQVADLKPLAELVNLRSLYAGGNKISDLAPVEKMAVLWTLSCEKNSISNLQPLTKITKLQTLNLNENQVEDLKSLAGMTDLQYLLLEKNKIKDLSTLVTMAEKDIKANQRFAAFWRVFLAGNPLSKDAMEKQIPKLVSFGGQIRYTTPAIKDPNPKDPPKKPAPKKEPAPKKKPASKKDSNEAKKKS